MDRLCARGWEGDQRRVMTGVGARLVRGRWRLSCWPAGCCLLRWPVDRDDGAQVWRRSSFTRLKASTRSGAQGQWAARRSRVRRPLRAITPAACSKQ